jgi:hypothetical protein
MSEELDVELDDFIEVIKEQIKSSTNFVNTHDWVTIKNFNSRKDMHDVQSTLTTRNMTYAVKLFDLASSRGLLQSKKVKRVIKSLLETFHVYKARHEQYFKDQDFTKLLLEQNKEFKMSDEMKFQSDITNTMMKLESDHRKLASMGDTPTVAIPTFNDVPIPLVMRQAAERKHPEILEVLDRKANPEKYAINDENEDSSDIETISSESDTESSGVFEE